MLEPFEFSLGFALYRDFGATVWHSRALLYR